jgi:hypothetical protein
LDKNYEEIYKDIPTYGRFLKVDEIDDLVKSISKFPNVKVRDIGKTIDDENLTMLEIGNGEKTALITGVPHSDEPLGSLVVTFFARWLATHPEKEYFGWRWLFVPILERRGMRLNEGWFNMPHSFDAHARSNFREPTDDQYEWTFPIEYEDYKWIKSRPETLLVKKVLEEEKPDLLCSLHHSGFHNGYFYLSEDFPEVYEDLKKLSKNCRIPLSNTSPDVPFGKMYEPGFYQMYGLKEYIDYYKTKDPMVLTTIKRGACSDEWYKQRIGGFSFNCEVPMYLSAKLQDKNLSTKTKKSMMKEKYGRNKNRLNYSQRIFNYIKDYSDLADPVLWDVAEKHLMNAQNSIAHEKRLLNKMDESIVSNAEVFENEVLADIFDLFFLGQIWRVAESICIKGGNPKICHLMDLADIEIKTLGKIVQERGDFYQLPIRNSVKMQLGSILIIAEYLKDK